MIQLTKRELNKLNTRKAKLAKLNNDLKEYFDASGDMSLPDIELDENQQALTLMEAGFTGAVDDINSGMLYYPDTKKNMVELFVNDLVNEMSGMGMDDSTTYSILYNDGTRKYLSNDDPSDFVNNDKIRSGITKKIYSDAKNALKISKVEAIIRSDGYNQPTYYISKGSTTDGETAMRKYGFELWKNGRGDKKRDYIQDDWV